MLFIQQKQQHPIQHTATIEVVTASLLLLFLIIATISGRGNNSPTLNKYQ